MEKFLNNDTRILGANKRLINGERLSKLNILPRVDFGILTVLCPEIHNYANRKNFVYFYLELYAA